MFKDIINADPVSALQKIIADRDGLTKVAELPTLQQAGDAIKQYAGRAWDSVKAHAQPLIDQAKQGDPLTLAGAGALVGGGLSAATELSRHPSRRRWANVLGAGAAGAGLGASAGLVAQSAPALLESARAAGAARGARPNSTLEVADMATGKAVAPVNAFGAAAGRAVDKHLPGVGAGSVVNAATGTIAGTAASAGLRTLPQGGNLMRGWQALDAAARTSAHGNLNVAGVPVSNEPALRSAMARLGNSSAPGLNRFDMELAARQGIPAAGRFTAMDRLRGLVGMAPKAPMAAGRDTALALRNAGRPALGIGALWPMALGLGVDGVRAGRSYMAQQAAGTK